VGRERGEKSSHTKRTEEWKEGGFEGGREGWVEGGCVRVKGHLNLYAAA